MSKQRDINAEMTRVLEELQLETIQQLLDRVRSGEATAAELGVARNLLRDNNMQVKPTGNSPLEKLGSELPAFDEDDPNVPVH